MGLNGLSLVHTVKCGSWASLFCFNPHHPCTDLLIYVKVWFSCSTCEMLLVFLHSVGLFSARDFMLGLLWSFSFLLPWWSVLSLTFYFALGKSSKMFIQMEFTWGMQRKAYAEAMGKHSSLGTLDKKGAQHFTLVLHSAVFNGKEYKIKTCSEVMFTSLRQPSVSPLTSGNNVT